MTINLGMFHAAFFDETAEHLADLERLLVDLDLEEPSPEALNAIFRAAHSIKGGSGTFGFTDMANLTHVLESVLDLLRKGEMTPTREMVDTFLTAGDVIHDQLDGHRAGQIVDPAAANNVSLRLESFLHTVPLSSDSSADHLQTVQPSTPTLHQWQLRFIFPSEAAGRGLDPLLAAWAKRGTVRIIHCPEDGKKEGSWEIHLTLADLAQEIREDLAFYADPAQIQIDPLSEKHIEEVVIPFELSAPSEESGYGFFVPLSTLTPPLTLSEPIEEGFGFFEGAPGTPIQDQGYGLFEDAPGAPKSDLKKESPLPLSNTSPVPVLPYGIFPGSPGAPEKTTTPESAEEGASRSSQSTSISKSHATKITESSSIRVGVEKVDQIMNLVGELVITQSMLAQIASKLDPAWTAQLQAGLDQLERNTRNLQESVMSIRMMPISVVFSRFPRLVRDLAGKLGKQVELATLGEGTELDKGLTEKLIDPLTHLVRNSLDHGIESPDSRQANGKDPTGHIVLSASHQGGNVVIEVQDDGAGLNRKRILEKAKERGLPVNDGLTDAEVWQLIFAPGFSTADQVTDISGRGVGMDVVRRNIQELRGTVDISSVAGQGSKFTVRLPLTLAILDGLSVAVGPDIFIISLGYIMESMRPRAEDIHTISGQGRLVRIRGEYLPILPLHEVFGIVPKVQSPEEGILVLLAAEGRRIALFVDQLVGQHQVVIKSLESNFRRVDGVSGATIMGDGRVALILDVGYLTRRAIRIGDPRPADSLKMM